MLNAVKLTKQFKECIVQLESYKLAPAITLKWHTRVCMYIRIQVHVSVLNNKAFYLPYPLPFLIFNINHLFTQANSEKLFKLLSHVA